MIPLDYHSAPPRPEQSRGIIVDIAYFLPMAVFLLFTWIGTQWPATYPAGYAAKTVIVAVALLAFRRYYTRISWHDWKLGILIGIVGVVQWVCMEKWLLHLWPNYPRLSVDVYIPTQAIHNPTLLWSFIAVRFAGAALLVPFMEELFWRDYLWRTIIAPADFKLADVGEWEFKAFAIVVVMFASVHVQWATAIVWGAMIGWLLVYTRSLGACIIAHAVTNFLLGGYVLWTTIWRGDPKGWYFW